MVPKLSFILLFLLLGCKNNQETTRSFQLKSNLNTELFIDISNETLANKIVFHDNTQIRLPKLEKYNYSLHSNFIKDTSFFLNRIDKNKSDKEIYNYCILSVNKALIFKILDSTCVQGSIYNKKYILSTSISNDKKKLAVIYGEGNISQYKNCILEIINLENKKNILTRTLDNRFFIDQNSWAIDNKRLVLYNSDKEIFILNLRNNDFKRVASSGYNAMWLQSLNSIAYLKDRNIIAVNNLYNSKEVTFKLEDKLFYRNTIQGYYWFSNQKKFLIKCRFSHSLGDKLVPWKNKNYILEYRPE